MLLFCIGEQLPQTRDGDYNIGAADGAISVEMTPSLERLGDAPDAADVPEIGGDPLPSLPRAWVSWEWVAASSRSSASLRRR